MTGCAGVWVQPPEGGECVCGGGDLSGRHRRPNGPMPCAGLPHGRRTAHGARTAHGMRTARSCPAGPCQWLARTPRSQEGSVALTCDLLGLLPGVELARPVSVGARRAAREVLAPLPPLAGRDPRVPGLVHCGRSRATSGAPPGRGGARGCRGASGRLLSAFSLSSGTSAPISGHLRPQPSPTHPAPPPSIKAIVCREARLRPGAKRGQWRASCLMPRPPVQPPAQLAQPGHAQLGLAQPEPPPPPPPTRPPPPPPPKWKSKSPPHARNQPRPAPPPRPCTQPITSPPSASATAPGPISKAPGTTQRAWMNAFGTGGWHSRAAGAQAVHLRNQNRCIKSG